MNRKFRFLHWLPIIGLFTVPIFEFRLMGKVGGVSMPWIILNGIVQGFYVVCTMITLIYFTSI